MDEQTRSKNPASALTSRDEPPADRIRRGEQLRKTVARSSHGAWSEPDARTDPVSLLEAQNTTRLSDLVPIRFGRMLESPFAFYRGSAAVMAMDLAGTPTTAIEVQACGDAHLANFGLYASPERHLVFDLNDFDETLPGPWEWDVKRLAASVVLAARSRGFSEKMARECALGVASGYREAINQFAVMNTMDIWYWHIDVDQRLEESLPGDSTKRVIQDRKQTRKLAARAHAHDTMQALGKLTEMRDGLRRIVNDPPLLVPVPLDLDTDLRPVFDSYLDTLSPDRRVLMERFKFVEGARKVVGVGSVGTRCWILLFQGGADDDPLFLQVKEANASVLETCWRPSACGNHAERVVLGQKLMQAESDIFLGWTRVPQSQIDYYIRQLRDMKGSVDLTTIKAHMLEGYAQVCGVVLARAHARSGDAALIAGYLGTNEVFDKALADFAQAYADQAERDYARLEKAAKKGRIPVERD